MADTSRGSRLLALPPELLRRILRLLSSDRVEDLIPYLTVCKLVFHHLRSMLWPRVLLGHDTILGFATGCLYGTRSYRKTRSLAVSLKNPIRPRNHPSTPPETRCVGDHAEPIYERGNLFESCQRDLCTKLVSIKTMLQARLFHLNTFALIIDNDPDEDPWCLCYRDEIPADYISNLLAAIPSTCEVLLVDTGGAESQEYNEITEVIAELFPNLRALRLRVRNISRELFDFTNAPFDLLETSAIMKWRTSSAYGDPNSLCSETRGRWESQREGGDCRGPPVDVLASLDWLKLSEQERTVS